MCGESQPMYLKGHVHDPETGKIILAGDMGYSFCNCWDIFFTNKDNLKPVYFDEDYAGKYAKTKPFFDKYAEKYMPIIKELMPDALNFLEIGCLHPAILDHAKNAGYETAGLDVFPRDIGEHRMIVSDFELNHPGPLGSHDIVWLSHVFEHFKDPQRAAHHLALVCRGLLFVAMPDPFQIDWNNYLSWQHWHCREHHILWDMKSFIRFMRGYGFECVYRHRNATPGKYICSGDYHLIFKK